MGWANKPSVHRPGGARSSRPVYRARTSTGDRCRPISRGVDIVERKRSSSVSVSVPHTRHDGAPHLAADPLTPHVHTDVISTKLDLERLFGLTSRASTPEAARKDMERDWHERSIDAVEGANRPIGKKLRRVRGLRSAGQPVVARQRNTVLAVAEQFLLRLENEVAEAEGGSRGDGLTANLRVLEHSETLRLLGVVQRCSSHSVDYASPDPSPHDVRRVAECLNTSASIARTILDQARRARALLIRFNVRLCAKMARKYLRPGSPDVDTLIAEACAGLSEAIDRFDRSRDMKFTTYATHWILRNLRLCVVNESGSSPVQLPPHIHYKLSKLLGMKEHLLLSSTAAQRAVYESDSNILNEAIAQKADMPVGDVATLLAAGLPTLDLDKPLFDDSSAGEHIDHLVQTNDGIEAGDSPEQALEQEAREQIAFGTLNSMLSTLDPRESNVLRLRFGLNYENKQLKRAEIAEAYGLTGERIRQIEQAALLKLSKSWRKDFMEKASKDLL